MKNLIIGLITFLLLISGCKSNNEINITNNTGSEDKTISDIQIQISEGHETLDPFVFKTSEPDKITVHGKLIVFDPWVTAPAADDAIFLVPLESMDGNNISSIPSFSIGDVPQAEVDERTGEFVFTNIQPEQYAVVIMTESGSQIPGSNPEGNLAIFTFDESMLGKTYDIGLINFP